MKDDEFELFRRIEEVKKTLGPVCRKFSGTVTVEVMRRFLARRVRPGLPGRPRKDKGK